MEYYTAERKRGFLPFVTAWMELETIMLHEIKSVGERYIVQPWATMKKITNKIQILKEGTKIEH